MTNNNAVCEHDHDHDHDHDEDFDFDDMMDEPSYDNAVMANIMTTMVDATNHQLNRAIDLTKVVVEKVDKNMSEEEIFNIFNKAADMIAERFPVKAMWDKAFEAE